MRRRIVLVALCLVFPSAALAHLCNDVFVQAKDNLAVKVDVRDGQLRIGEEASFRVYLLNTMDREIANIAMDVRTDGKFVGKVSPSPDWKSYPRLDSASPKRIRGKQGKKEYFEVTLTRKPGVPDGKYKIDLHLHNPKNKNQVFKTVDLGQAAGICEIPKAEVKIDGAASPEEWGKSFLCTGLSTHNKKKRYYVSAPAPDQGMFRVAADKDNLYLCLSFQGGAGATSDAATLYAAKTLEAKPVALGIDRLSGELSCEAGTTGVECKVSEGKDLVEIKVPRALLGVDGVKGFYANFTRTVKSGDQELVSYWRGNSFTVSDPVGYAHFKVEE